MERTPPVVAGRFSPRILSRLRPLAEVGQIPIDAALQGDIAIANERAQSIVMAVAAQALELRMRVEHKSGPPKASREASAVRVKPNDEQRASREAE